VTATVSRASRRKAETRHRLLTAAASVFADAGVDGATISAITDAADVGLGTFYLHFDDKDACAAAVADDLVTRIAEAAGDAEFGLSAATRAVCGVAASEARLLHALYRWHGSASSGGLRAAFVDRIARGMKGGIKSGVMRREDPVLAAHAVLGLYAESILYWASSGRDDWDALADFLERTTLAAFSA
jgi:AcrR family transcriptional regulator